MKFALLTLGAGIEATDFAFFAKSAQQLVDERRHFTLSADDIGLINPNSRTCPVFRSQMDADLTKQIYSRVPVLVDEKMGEASNPWKARFYTRLFHMAEDSHHFKSKEASHLNRLYEAKMIHIYDHRWATYSEDGSSIEMSLTEKQDPYHVAVPRYWVQADEVRSRLNNLNWNHSWLMGWRDICRSTDERTNIAGVMPYAGVGDTFLLLLPGDAHSSRFSCLLADMSALCRDFLVRQKIGGTHLKLHTQKQIPTLPPSTYTQAAIDFIQPRVLELTYTANDLKPWAEDLGYDGPPFRFDPERRALLRAELDAFYAHLYGLTRDELRYILDPADVMGPDYPSETFRVLKNNEIRQFGEYRTQRLVLEAWDRLFGGGG